MRDDFPAADRDQLLTSARRAVAARRAPVPTGAELTPGLPVFLDQPRQALCRAASRDVGDDDVHRR